MTSERTAEGSDGTDLDGSAHRPDSDGPAVSVRPFGYAEDHPVVRRLGDRDLYLGNHRAAHPGPHDPGFEYVLSLTSDDRPLTTHHHPLIDGRENDWPAFADAVDAARSLYHRDGAVLVHCKAGISRSTAVAATAIAAEEDRPFSDALADAQDARPHAVPHPTLHEQAVVYLAARA